MFVSFLDVQKTYNIIMIYLSEEACVQLPSHTVTVMSAGSFRTPTERSKDKQVYKS